ncbi:hypothetical protein D3C72_1966240 [compost metagenome]
MAVFDQADDVAHPQATAVSGDDPVIEGVVTSSQYFVVAVGLGADQVGGVNDVAPEARDQPMGQGITQQFFGMGGHVAVGEIVHLRFPRDSRQALHQAAVMVFANAQFLLQIDPAGNFRTQATVDPNDRGQHEGQQQQPR